MPTYFTPIPDVPNQIADADTFNDPMLQLDAGIGIAYARGDDALSIATVNNAELVAARSGYANLDARLDALVLGSGITATQANGAASAGQKVVVVDATSGFLAGSYIGYLLDNTTVEYNRIATIDSPTQFTLTTNIGAGGILDNTYIQVVSIAEYYNDGTFNSLFVGGGTPSGNDSAIIIGRNLTGAVNIEAFRDESAVASTGAGSAYNSFDAVPTISGAATHDHYHGFQSRPIYGSSGAVGRLASFWSAPVINGPTTALYHLHITDATGTGVVTVQAGIRIEDQTKGTTNYGIYQLGAAVLNYFQGPIQSSGRVFTSGSMDAATLGVGAQNSGAGVLEVNATGTAAQQYGIVSIFAYTGTEDPYGSYNSVSVENGKTTGGTSVYGGLSLATMTALADNCYVSASYGGHYQLSFNAAADLSVTALVANSLHVAAPGITGAGTIAIGSLAGLNVENQGTVKATTSYGVKVADQSGSATNYALYTGAGEVRFGDIVNFAGTMGNSSKNPASDAPADWVEIKIGATTLYLPAYAAS